MTEKEMAGRNMIIKVASGSHLYGTNTPESDLDYLGIFIPEEKYILGLSSIEQVDLSIIDKAQSGKNTKKAIDFVVYELRKFVNLALQNNPNILEILCVKPESTEYITEYGITLLELRDKIVSQLLIDRFYKYSLSQKKKMFVKSENYLMLKKSKVFFSVLDSNMYLLELNNKHIQKHIKNEMPDIVFNYIPETNLLSSIKYKQDTKPFIKVRYKKESESPVFFDVGDIKLQAIYYVKRAKSTINDRLERFSHRGDNIISKYNYDTKFASHLMRLLLECEEFIDNGKVIFPLQYADFLIDIKKGKYTIDEIIKESEKVEKRIVKKSETVNLKLREKPDFQYVENTIIKMLRSFLCK